MVQTDHQTSLLTAIFLLLLVGCRSVAPSTGPGSPPFRTPATVANGPKSATAATTMPLATPLPAETADTFTGHAPVAVTPGQTRRASPTVLSPSFTKEEVIGYSVDGRPLTAARIGQGDRILVIVGSLHGGHECNTGTLLKLLQTRLTADPARLPPTVRLYILPVANPDGCQLGMRENGHQVDLNRNWDTPDWTADAAGPQGLENGSGGARPFSEPETSALRDWLLALKSRPHRGRLHLISYHSAVPPNGLVLPGYRTPGKPQPASRELAELFTSASSYPYSAEWIGNYEITGELIHWAVLQDLVAIDVELPIRARLEDLPPEALEALVDTNLDAWRAVIGHLNTPSSRRRRSG